MKSFATRVETFLWISHLGDLIFHWLPDRVSGWSPSFQEILSLQKLRVTHVMVFVIYFLELPQASGWSRGSGWWWLHWWCFWVSTQSGSTRRIKGDLHARCGRLASWTWSQTQHRWPELDEDDEGGDCSGAGSAGGCCTGWARFCAGL